MHVYIFMRIYTVVLGFRLACSCKAQGPGYKITAVIMVGARCQEWLREVRCKSLWVQGVWIGNVSVHVSFATASYAKMLDSA